MWFVVCNGRSDDDTFASRFCFFPPSADTSFSHYHYVLAPPSEYHEYQRGTASEFMFSTIVARLTAVFAHLIAHFYQHSSANERKTLTRFYAQQ